MQILRYYALLNHIERLSRVTNEPIHKILKTRSHTQKTQDINIEMYNTHTYWNQECRADNEQIYLIAEIQPIQISERLTTVCNAP